MHQKNFVICDQEADYARNLMQMIGGRKELGFQMHMFQKLEPLKKFAEQKPIQILLIGEEYSQEERLEIPAAERFVLVKAEGRYLADEEKELYKYQSVDQILTKVLELSVDKERAVAKTLRKTRGSLIGVYSPIHRIGKTKYALELGKELAEKGPVLYLNLEEYAGFEQLFSCTYEKNLSDLLYYIRQDSSNLIFRINSMVQSFQNMDYLPPALSPADLMAASWEEWSKLFDTLKKQSSYEVILLDVGSCIPELYTMLEQCDRVYMPVREETASRAKVEQFENLVQMWDCGEMLKRVKKVNLPYHTSEKKGNAYVEELVWSQMGDYVRELLREEQL